MKHVMTVFGQVVPEELGVTDAHSHGWIEHVPGADLEALIHDDEDGICRDLAAYRDLGGQSIIDCQPGLCGRNGNKLRSISQGSGVHIVACTGFHLQRYYPARTELFAMTAGKAAQFFLNEIREGLVESLTDDAPVDAPVYPGFIKIAAEATLAASPMALFEAAAEVSRQTGLAIEMHTEQGAAVEYFLDFFSRQGLAPERLVFCHVDKRPDFGLHRELASAGVMLEYDTFVRPKYEPETKAWPLLQEMIASGLSDQVALATDLALTNQWSYAGGSPGPAAFLSVVRDRLIDTGIESEVVTRLTGRNIADRLAI
jgi:phosphotriesterase-related protein